MKMAVTTLSAPAATGPFSQAIISDNLIFTSGQIYLTKEGKLLEGTLDEQVHQIMDNLQAILAEAGADFTKVLKTAIYVTDMSMYAVINEVYCSDMSVPFTAREVVCVKELPLGAKVEISMVAEKK